MRNIKHCDVRHSASFRALIDVIYDDLMPITIMSSNRNVKSTNEVPTTMVAEQMVEVPPGADRGGLKSSRAGFGDRTIYI